MKIVVVGGGAIGSSAAMFLRRRLPTASVTVVERDSSYTKASSALSASSIRQQFSAPCNIQLSQFGLDYLRQRRVTEAVQFREGGYLYLASTDEGAQILKENQALQTSMGADIRLLDSTASIKKAFPQMNVEDLKTGCLGVSGEGWFDGFSLLKHLREEAIKEGAIFCKGEVNQFHCRDNAVVSVTFKPSEGSAPPQTLDCDFVVNAGGPWARSVAALAGLDCPVFARRRVVYIIKTAESMTFPLVIDPSGIWFRSDCPSHYLVGFSPPEGTSDCDDLPLEAVDTDRTTFDEFVWPALAHRVPEFESLSLKSWWAGYYEVHPMDHNAIIGPHPTKLRNFLFANGFSGHGIQHSIGVGRAITELIVDGSFTSIDLSPLGYDRVLKHQPYHEKNII
jgi:glycine/D-amino acid oxidase-like deaminating enzyme